MKILMVHQNFPGQFKHLAPALASRGHEVIALAMAQGQLGSAPDQNWQGVRVLMHSPSRATTPGAHPWVTDFETKVIRAESCFRAAVRLKDQGFSPDVIVAHPGWGESLFLKEVWPKARLGIYCEFFYKTEGADVDFDPEFPSEDPLGNSCRLHLKNLNNFLHFGFADSALSPTQWQASTFPEAFRSRITVQHDGIDTNLVAPNPQVEMTIRTASGQSIGLNKSSEVITFVNRNLEPYRGFHVFMRALPELLARRPNARVLIVGGNSVSYGIAPSPARFGPLKSWREVYLREIAPRLSPDEMERIHFLGRVAYPQFVNLLQLSTVHVYLTYPFVLSWSLLEAMSAGCAIVASDTEPVREAIAHGKRGLLVDFFDQQGLVNEVCALLENPEKREKIGKAARSFAIKNYDLQSICLPGQVRWVEGMNER